MIELNFDHTQIFAFYLFNLNQVFTEMIGAFYAYIMDSSIDPTFEFINFANLMA
jgi:hypothetical protein